MKALPELPVLLGREAGHLFKHLGEIALVLITAGDRDFHDRIICVGQKPCRLFNTDSVKMLLECHSGHLPEQGGKIRCINVQMLRNRRQRNVFRKVLGNIFGGIFD